MAMFSYTQTDLATISFGHLEERENLQFTFRRILIKLEQDMKNK
jgi:hypothetical protein